MLLTITLRSRVGVIYAVAGHRAVFDVIEDANPTRRDDSVVDVHEDCCIAPAVAQLNGMPAQDSIGALTALLGKLQADHEDRHDGIDLAALLLGWAERWRDAWWEVSGVAVTETAARGIGGIDLDGVRRARYSPAMVRMAEPIENHPDPDQCTMFDCEPCNRVNGKTLQRETRVPGGGSSSSSVGRAEKPARRNDAVAKMINDIKTRDGSPNGEAETWEANEAVAAQQAIANAAVPAGPRMKVVTARVSDGAHERLIEKRPADAPTIGEYVEALHRVLSGGRTPAEVMTMLNDMIAGGTVRPAAA